MKLCTGLMDGATAFMAGTTHTFTGMVSMAAMMAMAGILLTDVADVAGALAAGGVFGNFI